MLERQLEKVGPGTHICPIYTTPADWLRVLVAFFAGGLRHGEQCLYFADPERATEVAQALQALGAHARRTIERGAIVVITTREQYVRDGHFEPQAMFELQDALSRQARSSGFSALRVASEMSWVLGSDIGTERFLEYEAVLNSTPPASGRSILCQYDGRRTQPPVIRDVLRTHPLAIIGERVHNNLHYEPFDLVLGRGDAERARADWMVQRLEAPTRREIALFDVGRLIVEGASLGDAMRAAPDLIAAGLQVDYVHLLELLPLGDAVQLIGCSGQNRAAIGSVERLDPESLLADAPLRAGQPVVIHDWQDETRLKLPESLRDAGGTTGIVISVGRDEHVYGFLSALSGQPRIFSDDEILFLEAVGHLLACAFAAARSERSFRALVENGADVIVRFSGDLRIIYANPALERLTGTAAWTLVGKTAADLGILEPLVPTWELLLRQVWRTGREQQFELTVRSPTGQRVFDSRIVAEPGPDGTVQSLLTISRDVTEQRRAEADRSALYQQLMVQQNRVQEVMGRLAGDRARTLERTASASQVEYLSARERHVLRLLAAGQTNREIGAEIGLSAGTVKNYVARILSKLNVTDRVQAAVRAVALGLVERPEQDVQGDVQDEP
jgi:PAS domain S-box-containing protein